MDRPAPKRNTPPSLSIVVVTFNMRRELARTLLSLSKSYQHDADALDYEVIVVDNGSDEPPVEEEFAGLGLNLRVVRQPDPTRSPVAAANLGLSLCRGELICVIIDGARMASPGLLAACTRAARLHHRPIVFTQSLTLGHGVQHLIVREGYDRRVEDGLLDSIQWPQDGYRLFEISTGLKSEIGEMKWAAPLYESNALFMPAVLWRETGGYEPLFQTPGGGCASMDLFQRACVLPDTQLIVITGEATFHQIHTNSVSTAAPDATDKLKLFSREYHHIRKRPLRPASCGYWTFGVVRSPPEHPPAPPAVSASTEDLPRRYVDLMKEVLLNEHGLELEATCLAMHDMLGGGTQPRVAPERVERARVRLARARAVGVTLATYPSGYTMIGRRRLDNVERLMNAALDDGVAGDFMECGVWRGGACILMRGILHARGVRDRTVWVADSFSGLPPPRGEADEDLDMTQDTYPGLAISLDRVRWHFARFGLSDDQVRFLPGWFCDTLPTAPIERLAVLRLDGDLYSSTMDALTSLYDKVASGGFVIIDDYGGIPQCARAVKDFRAAHSITEPIEKIDWTGVYWRKA